jgi:hypothetical protein
VLGCQVSIIIYYPFGHSSHLSGRCFRRTHSASAIAIFGRRNTLSITSSAMPFFGSKTPAASKPSSSGPKTSGNGSQGIRSNASSNGATFF